MRLTTNGKSVALMVLAVAMVGLLAGCQTSKPCCDEVGALPPAGLPDSPSPCATYCKEWVPPVTRKVPELVKVRDGYMKETPYCVKTTSYDDVVIEPRQCACPKTTATRRCEESLVEVKPGGHRWVQNDDGCWKYQYCNPEYKWCTRTRVEEGVEYCVDKPPVYETVERVNHEMKMRREYVPAEYAIRYREQVYEPGRYRFRATQDCNNCVTGACNDRKSYRTVLTENCERCN